MLKSREGGSFEVAGTVETLGEDVTVKVTVLPAVPVYADMPPAQEIWVGGTPALPETLTVTWSNGDVSDEPVTWDELDTTVAGTLTATGTIEGLSSPVMAQVTVKPLEVASVEGQDVELDIASGEMNADTLFAALPATASVSWSDGSVTEEPIAWSALPGEQEAALSSRGAAAFTLSGVVGETGVAASAKIKVEAATMVSAEAVPAQQVWVGGAPELPGTVAVTWSNGDVTDEPVSWGAADTSQPGALEVQGAVEGLADPVVATVDVKAPEAVSAELSDVEAQTLEVEPGAVPDLPATVQVSWSDGQTSEESVVWDVPSAEEFVAGTDVKISGEVETTQQSVEVTVHVKDEESVPAPQTESDSDKDAATATDTKAGEGDAESQTAASPTKPDAAAEQSGKADQVDSTTKPDAAVAQDSKADQVDSTPKPDATAEQSGKDDKTDQGDSASQPDAAADKDSKADQAATVPQPQPAAPEKSHATDVTSSGERQQAGLPAWVIATLAGLGAAFVAAVAFVVSKRRRAEDDEPIGKHAAPKNK